MSFARFRPLRSRCRLATALTTVGWLAVAGCARQEPSPAEAPPARTAGADARHPVTGIIVSVHQERRTLLVDHHEIPGVMPRMTMEFKVGAGDLANARAGQRIRGTIYQSADGFHLEGMWPLEDMADRLVSEATRQLRQDTVTRGSGVYREVGENLPDFALYDQTGAVVSAARFRGRPVVLNFIFTRCPDATMCPAATTRMIELQRQARAAGVDNLELISITLDPEYDSPGVLREYAMAHGIDTSNFSLLTGPESAIKDLLAQLGVHAFQDGPLITHTLATVLMRENGQIAHRVDGRQWDPADFVARMRRTAAAAAPPGAAPRP